MASKVTPLYAQTRILLNLWSLEEAPVAKSHFVPGSAAAYKSALSALVEAGALSKEKVKGYDRYQLTKDGETELAKGLANDDFSFGGSVIGAKTTNAILHWFRQNASSAVSRDEVASSASQRDEAHQIKSYDSFERALLTAYDQLNQDYNLDDLVPIYRLRREVGDRLSRQQFNEWLLEIQSNDLVQLMGGDLPDVTPDQLEDSVSIPGGGTRFYVKRLQ